MTLQDAIEALNRSLERIAEIAQTNRQLTEKILDIIKESQND